MLNHIAVSLLVFLFVCLFFHSKGPRIRLSLTPKLLNFFLQTSCTVLAVFLHFFTLSIFCWMLSEGIQLYFSLVKVIGVTYFINIKFFYSLGWGKLYCLVNVSVQIQQKIFLIIIYISNSLKLEMNCSIISKPFYALKSKKKNVIHLTYTCG